MANCRKQEKEKKANTSIKPEKNALFRELIYSLKTILCVSNLVMICYWVIATIIKPQTLLDTTLLLLESLLDSNSALDNEDTGSICKRLPKLVLFINKSNIMIYKIE